VTGPVDVQSLNDSQILSRLSEQVGKLLQEKRIAPAAAIAEELKTSRVKLSLPAPNCAGMTAEEIYGKRAAGVLIVASLHDKPQLHVHASSGFVLTATGVAVTNYHVMANPEMIGWVAMTRSGEVVPVKGVLAASESLDVAIIQLEGKGFTPIALAARAPVGADVFVISHPAGRFWYMSRGMVSRYATMVRKRDPVDAMQITADYAHGSSGAAILSAAGEAVGMVSSTSSIYYSDDNKGVQKDLQMVFKNCVTSQQILSLIERQDP